MTTTTYPAQIVFAEVDDVTGPRRWTGRLLRQSACVDVGWRGGAERPRPVTWCPKFDITENAQTGRCAVRMNGGNTPSSLRYQSYADVNAAMKAGIRWAARRFRVPAETGDTITDDDIAWLVRTCYGEGGEASEVRRLSFTVCRDDGESRRVARARLAEILNARSRA
jgi:hypothetical protein